MDIRKLQRAIVDGLEDVKAQNIVVFNTERLSPLFERVIIASGASNRQTKALASSVREVVKGRGMDVLRTEGEDNGEWIIVDCGAAVVHVMQPAIRDYYHLEEIWGDKPVRMKLDAAPLKLVKAAQVPSDSASAMPGHATPGHATPRGSARARPRGPAESTRTAHAAGTQQAARGAAGKKRAAPSRGAGKPPAPPAGTRKAGTGKAGARKGGAPRRVVHR
jgi:ribosome-associated protein